MTEIKLYRFAEGRIEEASDIEPGYQYFTAVTVDGMVKSINLIPVI